MSSASVSALFTRQPSQLKLTTLLALCTALQCTPTTCSTSTPPRLNGPQCQLRPSSRAPGPGPHGAGRCRRSEGPQPVTVKISECVRCGRPVGIAGREHCTRCHYALAHRPARNQCPGCSQLRKLDEVTGKCVLCSRTCVRCGGKMGRVGRDICSLCLVKARRADAQRRCPRCGKPGRIRAATGWCGHCSHPGRPPGPDAACRACGLVTHLEGDELCFPCYSAVPVGEGACARPPAWPWSHPATSRRTGSPQEAPVAA
jgi:hypothetical protein